MHSECRDAQLGTCICKFRPGRAAHNPEITSDSGGPFSLPSCLPHPPQQQGTSGIFSRHCAGSSPASRHPSASSLPALEMPHSNLGTSHAQTQAGRAKETTHCLRWAQPCVCSSRGPGSGPGAGALAGGQARSGRHLSLLGDLATPACPNG